MLGTLASKKGCMASHECTASTCSWSLGKLPRREGLLLCTQPCIDSECHAMPCQSWLLLAQLLTAPPAAAAPLMEPPRPPPHKSSHDDEQCSSHDNEQCIASSCQPWLLQLQLNSCRGPAWEGGPASERSHSHLLPCCAAGTARCRCSTTGLDSHAWEPV